MEQKVITIIGGTGFLGRYVVKRLAHAGYTLRIIARNPDAARRLKTAGDIGQIVIVRGNLNAPETLEGKLDGSWAVINLVGILFESGRQNFSQLHAQGAEALAKMAKAAGVTRFIHMSSLGADKAGSSQYARSKISGEKAVRAAFPEATILRPSILFGPEDNFFNQFAAMACISPALPLIGGGGTRFQPVYAGDVADMVERCLQRPDTAGQTFELGGPHTYTFKEILEYILRTTGRERKLVNVPFSMAKAVGAVGELLPRPPITRDQVALLKYDNLVSPNAKTFANLGLKPTAVDIIVPGYLARFSKGAKLAA